MLNIWTYNTQILQKLQKLEFLSVIWLVFMQLVVDWVTHFDTTNNFQFFSHFISLKTKLVKITHFGLSKDTFSFGTFST